MWTMNYLLFLLIYLSLFWQIGSLVYIVKNPINKMLEGQKI